MRSQAPIQKCKRGVGVSLAPPLECFWRKAPALELAAGVGFILRLFVAHDKQMMLVTTATA